jgi:hypothetical protein
MAAPRLSLLPVTLVTAALLGACATGPRPSFDADEPVLGPTGDPAVDAVLERLDAVGREAFTADYEILTRLGGRESTATVVHAGDGRRSITVNDIRFIDGTGANATCQLATGTCEALINDARVSDVQLTHDFYGPSMARRLRVDAGRSIGDVQGYEITQADQQALCVDVPVTGGTKVYCALESGVLARYDGADLFIELTRADPIPDESAFATS